MKDSKAENAFDKLKSAKEASPKSDAECDSIPSVKEANTHNNEKLPAEGRINDLTETLQRLQAEFENYKKRVEKEKQDCMAYAKAGVIIKLLPVLDSIELAIKNTGNREDFTKGVEMIFAQIRSALKTEGLRPIECVNEKFDPYRHEVLLKQESEKEEDTVLEELQKGYMLGCMCLRPSKVKVSKPRLQKQSIQKDGKV